MEHVAEPQSKWTGDPYSYTETVSYYEPTSYLYDMTMENAQVLAEYAGTSTQAKETYNYGASGRTSGAEAGVYIYDGRGSVSETVKAGRVTNTLRYDPYGSVICGAPKQDRIYAYNGEQYTPQTGLIYLRARNYDPATGTFTSRDTYLGDQLNPVTRNRYTYANNNPVMYQDPSGHAGILKWALDGIKKGFDLFKNAGKSSSKPKSSPVKPASSGGSSSKGGSSSRSSSGSSSSSSGWSEPAPIPNGTARYNSSRTNRPGIKSPSLWDKAKDKIEDGLSTIIKGKETVAEGIQSAKTWWKGTTLSKNLNKAASSVTKAWKNSSIGKKVTATVDKVNKAAQNIKDKWNNSSIGQFCNKAKNTVTDFYEEHKTAINFVAGAAVIAVCGVAMIATGPMGCCMAAVAAKGAFFGAVGGAVSGAIGGGVNSAISYMEEHGTLDGAGKDILGGIAAGFAAGGFSGAISGAIGGSIAYKKNPTGYCFVSGTFVLTTLGYAGIECIRAGDYVYAKDEETGEQEYMPVLDTFTNEVTEICTLTIDGETIETTVGHPFYSVENGWINAGDLSEGDTVELSDGSSGRVENVEITELDEPVTVYNFCVMDFHTYYVGENEVLVHNTCKKADVSGSKSNSHLSNQQANKIKNEILEGKDVNFKTKSDAESFIEKKFSDFPKESAGQRSSE